MAASGEEITVCFKVNTGKKFDLKLSPTLTVLEAKKKAETESEVPPAQQRLIYRGRILKDGESLSSYGISSGHTIHLVRSSIGGQVPAQPTAERTETTTTSSSVSPASLPGTSFSSTGTRGAVNPLTAGGVPNTGLDGLFESMGGAAGLGGLIMNGGGAPPGEMNPALFQSMMSNSMMQNMMQQVMSNPEMLRTIINSNPLLSQMANANPMLQSMLSNPEVLRSMFTSEMMQQALQMQQALHSQQASPTSPTTHSDGSTTTDRSAPTLANQNRTQTPGLGATPLLPPGGTVGPNQEFNEMMNRILLDPELMRQAQQMMTGLTRANAGTTARVDGASPAVPNMANLLEMMAAGGNNVPPTERYRNELQQLKDMGFIDAEANLTALVQTRGDVNAAIVWLLESGHGS